MYITLQADKINIILSLSIFACFLFKLASIKLKCAEEKMYKQQKEFKKNLLICLH